MQIETSDENEKNRVNKEHNSEEREGTKELFLCILFDSSSTFEVESK